MKKKMYRMMAATLGVILAAAPLNASAELLEPPITPDELYSIVIAVNEGGNCLIANEYENWVITQEEFHQYADVDFDLKPGDVIFCYDAASVTSGSYAYGYYTYADGEKDPLQVYFEETATIKYLGTAQEFYGEQVKELTVTDTTKRYMAMTDEEGTIYYTRDAYTWGWAESGESYGIPSGGYKVGDKVLCATVDMYQSSSYPSVSAMILEKTYEAEEPDYNVLSPIVTAVSEDGESCLLSDGSTVTQAEFHQCMGETSDLQKGDVITVDRTEDAVQITYLGKAEEVYAEYVQELTVTDMDKNGEPVWRDADGIVYHAEISYSDAWTKSGTLNNGFQMRDFWVDESALCVTGITENRDYFGCGAVILERTAEVEKPLGDTSIVVAISGNHVMLSNDIAIYQGTFKGYSGEDFDLEVGDVISVQRTDNSYFMVNETYPASYVFDIYSRIVYRGKAKDFYADMVKELTVTDMDDGYPVWSDEDGETYRAYSSYIPDIWLWNADDGGVSIIGFRPSDFSIGDKVLGVVRNNLNYNTAVIIEQTYEAPHTAGDATGDGNTDIVDVIAVNKHILLGELLSQAGIDAVDFNGNGKVDATESLHLLKYVVKIVDALQFE